MSELAIPFDIVSLSYLSIINRDGLLKKYDVAISRNENDSYILHRNKFNGNNYIHLCICASYQLVDFLYLTKQIYCFKY